MPHRKWNLEFKKDGFPNYNDFIDAPQTDIDRSCRITDVIVLPGMSERIMLIPIKDSVGKTLGICGFEVSESIFKLNHAQPTNLEHLICVFSRKNDNSTNCDEGMSCGAENGYFLSVKGNLEKRNVNNRLNEYKNEYGFYIGISSDIPLCIQNNNYEITVMIPKADYVKNQTSELIQIFLIVLLLCFAAMVLCMYFSKRYLSPIIKGLNKLKQSETNNEPSNISEIDEIYDYLAEKSNSYKKSIEELNNKNKLAQTTIDTLSYNRKKEVSPDDYEYFLTGLKTLTPAENKIFKLCLEGKTIRQIAEESGIKESTVKFHNHNIYDKLGVTNKKELLRFAAIYLKEE